ncbi:MAG: GTP-binding protein [Candidatus Thorarchaeota archaeon]
MGVRSVKLAVIGSGGAGKSTLITRLSTGIYVDRKMTVGIDIETWTIVPNDSGAIRVSCFDFGGQKQFRFFQGSLMIGANLLLIVVDCSNFHSFLEIHDWLPMAEHIPNERKVLVGTKIDQPCVVTEEDISEMAEKLGVQFVMVSSKTGENLDELTELLRHIMKMV